MTQDDIIRMAREAGLIREWMDLCKKDEEALARFTALVRAAEREACAKVCDVTPPYPFRPSIEAAHAIRARSKA